MAEPHPRSVQRRFAEDRQGDNPAPPTGVPLTTVPRGSGAPNPHCSDATMCHTHLRAADVCRLGVLESPLRSHKVLQVLLAGAGAPAPRRLFPPPGCPTFSVVQLSGILRCGVVGVCAMLGGLPLLSEGVQDQHFCEISSPNIKIISCSFRER